MRIIICLISLISGTLRYGLEISPTDCVYTQLQYELAKWMYYKEHYDLLSASLASSGNTLKSINQTSIQVRIKVTRRITIIIGMALVRASVRQSS